MAPLQPSSGHELSQPAVIAISCFVAICLLFFLSFALTLLRRRWNSVSKTNPALRRFSYDTFDAQTTTPSIFLDEHFIQPPSSSCRSTTLSPIHEIHSEGLNIPVLSHRRHSAPKSITHLRGSEKRSLHRPVNSCIQFSHACAESPTLHLSITYVHTVELLRVVADKVTGLPPTPGVPMLYTLQVRVMPRSRTSAYLSKPLITPVVAEYPEFDHLFEYAVSLQRLERARIEATLFARALSDTLRCGRRRYTVDAIPYVSSGSGVGRARGEVNQTEFLKDYREVGKAELVIDTCVLRSCPTAMEHLALPLSLVKEESADVEEANETEGGAE